MNTNNNGGVSRRNALKSMGAVSSLAATGSLLSFGKVTAAGTYEVNMQLGWLASNGILGEVAADKLGFYADEGLSLKIIAGGPNIDGVASVASGRANLGSISSSPDRQRVV